MDTVVQENKFWIATEESPVYLFYCKANICSGKTVVVMQNNVKTFCNEIYFDGLRGTFKHQNSTGKAKSSGARNTLKIINGRVILVK